MNKKFEFEAIPSGDYECFCFAVDKETYIAIEGRDPEKWDRSPFNKGLFNLYPNTFFELRKTHKYRVKIELEVIEENVERIEDDGSDDEEEEE